MKKNIFLPKFSENGRPLRCIHSFIRRQRRLTKRQQYALDNYWPTIGIEFSEQLLDFSKLFNCDAPVTLEIGFGTGSSLVTMAKTFPKLNFLGVEVYLPGISSCLISACEYGEKIKNLRIIYYDAIEVLQKMVSNGSLSTVQLFFPDPWHKTRHNKRRIIQTSFVKLVKRKLKLGGIFHVVTDWEPYAKHILNIISSLDGYNHQSNNSNYISSQILLRPITKFEQRGRLLGYNIRELIFKKIK